MHLVGKQTYKIELFKKMKIHNLFYVLLLEQNTTRKGQVETAIMLDKSNNKEYKLETIRNNMVYISKLEGHLPDLYYLIL